MVLALEHRRFTVHEYHRMAEVDVLGEDERVELIDGEIVAMTPISQRHAAAVKRLNRLLTRLPENEVIVSVRNPIQLDDSSEPEPDAALLRYRDDFYAAAHPTAGDVLLLVEVAESSAEYDRGVKLPLYARAGVPEVWIVDLRDGIIAVHRLPSPDGFWECRTLGADESLSPQSYPDLVLAVNDIIGR